MVHRTVIPCVDLRVDDHPDPVAELRRLYGLLRAEDYDFLRAVAADERASESPEDYPG